MVGSGSGVPRFGELARHTSKPHLRLSFWRRWHTSTQIVHNIFALRVSLLETENSRVSGYKAESLRGSCRHSSQHRSQRANDASRHSRTPMDFILRKNSGFCRTDPGKAGLIGFVFAHSSSEIAK